jgi:hypothetical protein
MARSRERGTGSVYLPEDPKNPGQKVQTYWISYYIDGKRKRESSESRKKSLRRAGERVGPPSRALRRLEGARHHAQCHLEEPDRA